MAFSILHMFSSRCFQRAAHTTSLLTGSEARPPAWAHFVSRRVQHSFQTRGSLAPGDMKEFSMGFKAEEFTSLHAATALPRSAPAPGGSGGNFSLMEAFSASPSVQLSSEALMRPAAVAASLSTIMLCVLLLCHAAAAESGRRWTDELIVLQNVLEKLQSRKLSTLKRRQSRLPTCEVGAWCSVKKGPHFGQLCDCQRGFRCNYFFLKCL